MKETFEDYLQRLKDRRTEDNYKYTDEDFEKHKDYISDCCKSGMSVYKCLEFMYFAEREIQPEQIWNDEKKEGLKEFINKHKQETLEEAKIKHTKFCIENNIENPPFSFDKGAKWQQEQHNFLSGFIKQFDPNEGEIKGWTAVEFLKWLELNKFKIVK